MASVFCWQSTGQNSSRYGFTSLVDIRTRVCRRREVEVEEKRKEASATAAGKLEQVEDLQ